MFHIAGQQFLHRRGIFDDDVREQQVAWARNFLATPAGSEWWVHDQQVAAYPRDFVKLLNEEA